MSILEIGERFHNPLEADRYFEGFRWPDGPQCGYCGSKHVTPVQVDGRRKCNMCKQSSSVKTNTQLHDSRLPLKTWLCAFSLMKDAKKGLSAMQLMRNLNIGYPTAWAMGHKVRELMMMENDGVSLSGILEEDETAIGGKPRKFNDRIHKENSKHHRIPSLDTKIDALKEEGFDFSPKGHHPSKSEIGVRGKGADRIIVAGIVQRDGDVIAEVVNGTGYRDLIKLVNDYVSNPDKSVLITDEATGYNNFDAVIEHLKINHKKLYSYRGVNTNSIESFWAIIKRQILGQHHFVSPKHLPKYIAECVFKYNNRKEDDMFETLVENAMKTLN